jgi:hypothetical protein
MTTPPKALKLIQENQQRCDKVLNLSGQGLTEDSSRSLLTHSFVRAFRTFEIICEIVL